MKSEELLTEIRRLFESFDKDLDEVSKDVAFVKGTIAEMQRHNGRVIKVLAAVITTLLGIIAWLVAR